MHPIVCAQSMIFRECVSTTLFSDNFSKPEVDIIDLTHQDHDSDMSKALQMSLDDAKDVHFGPSDRAPSVHWAMVPANVSFTYFNTFPVTNYFLRFNLMSTLLIRLKRIKR